MAGKSKFALAIAAACMAVTSPVASGIAAAQELPPYLQCVPYARQQSGIQIYGDAYSWWDQAEGRYARGHSPRVGAVMAFRPHRNMRLGHVAAVSKIIDSRTVLLDHANWSPINGRRGQIERGVIAVDVSPANDWSQVRVWYDPIQAVGKTAWPVAGFIYADGAAPERADPPVRIARNEAPSKTFLNAFAGMDEPARSPRRVAAAEPRSQRKAGTTRPAASRPTDPYADLIASYE